MANKLTLIQRLNSFWSSKKSYDKIIIIFSVTFLVIVGMFAVVNGVFFSPDQFFAVAFLVALILGQAKSFIWDWTPVLLLILSYEYLRGLIPKFDHITVHMKAMSEFDKLIFHGTVPAVFLQQHFYNPAHLHWYDYASVILYMMHFIVPLAVAFYFWLADRQYFRKYVVAMVVLSYLTFLTYALFPAGPPWMGAQQGIIPHIYHVTDNVVAHMFHSISLPTVYAYFGANLVAAVPSLHVAYPMLTALFVGKKYPKLIPLLILYIVAISLAVMYLGEHYFFDVTLGIVYAMFIYALTQRIWKVLNLKSAKV